MEIAGVWDIGTVERWAADLIDFLPRECHRNEDLRMLVDVRHRTIHAKDVAARVQARIAWVAPHFTRIAVVLSDSALLAMQSRRLALAAEVMDRQRFFAASDMAAAHAWLGEGKYDNHPDREISSDISTGSWQNG